MVNNTNPKTEIFDDRLIAKESKQFKRETLKAIRNKSFYVEHKSLKDNYRYFEGFYKALIYYFLQDDASLDCFIEKYKDSAFLFNVGYRGSCFKVRNYFHIFATSKINPEHSPCFTIESWNGRIVSSDLPLPDDVFDVFGLMAYVNNNEQIKSSYDWTSLNRVFETHFMDIDLGRKLVLNAVEIIKKRDAIKAAKLNADYEAYKKNASIKQCDDKEAFIFELLKKREEEKARKEAEEKAKKKAEENELNGQLLVKSIDSSIKIPV